MADTGPIVPFPKAPPETGLKRKLGEEEEVKGVPEAKKPRMHERKKQVIMAAELRKKLVIAFPQNEPSEADTLAFLKTLKITDWRQLGLVGIKSFKHFKARQGLKWGNGKVVEPSEKTLKKNILDQMEFYFGDGNLPRDDFLQAQLKKNEQRWIPLSIFLKFRKIQDWTTDVAFLGSVLADSVFVELDADKKNVRRIHACTKTKEDLLHQTTIVNHIPGYKTDAELRDMFQQHGELLALYRKRRHKKKGSVRVELIWVNKETAENFSELKTLKFPDNDAVEMPIEAPKALQEKKEECVRNFCITSFNKDSTWAEMKNHLKTIGVEADFVVVNKQRCWVKLPEGGLLGKEAVKLVNDSTAMLGDQKLTAREVTADDSETLKHLRPDTKKKKGKKRKRLGPRGGNKRKRKY